MKSDMQGLKVKLVRFQVNSSEQAELVVSRNNLVKQPGSVIHARTSLYFTFGQEERYNHENLSYPRL